MKTVLVVYATNAGSTVEVAQAIAEELGRDGDQVQLQPVEGVAGLGDAGAVVLAAPMIMGWHRAAVKFLKTHQTALSRLPVAYAFTAMSLTQTGETTLDGLPLAIDRYLAKPPATPGRLSYRERYALPASYLRPVLKAVPAVKPVSVAFFGGKLDMRRLRLLHMLFVLLVIQAQPGDFRDWDFIRSWAADLRLLLKD